MFLAAAFALSSNAILFLRFCYQPSFKVRLQP